MQTHRAKGKAYGRESQVAANLAALAAPAGEPLRPAVAGADNVLQRLMTFISAPEIHADQCAFTESQKN